MKPKKSAARVDVSSLTLRGLVDFISIVYLIFSHFFCFFRVVYLSTSVESSERHIFPSFLRGYTNPCMSLPSLVRRCGEIIGFYVASGGIMMPRKWMFH